jgi:hypothetical protein
LLTVDVAGDQQHDKDRRGNLVRFEVFQDSPDVLWVGTVHGEQGTQEIFQGEQEGDADDHPAPVGAADEPALQDAAKEQFLQEGGGQCAFKDNGDPRKDGWLSLGGLEQRMGLGRFPHPRVVTESHDQVETKYQRGQHQPEAIAGQQVGEAAGSVPTQLIGPGPTGQPKNEEDGGDLQRQRRQVEPMLMGIGRFIRFARRHPAETLSDAHEKRDPEDIGREDGDHLQAAPGNGPVVLGRKVAIRREPVPDPGHRQSGGHHE